MKVGLAFIALVGQVGFKKFNLGIQTSTAIRFNFWELESEFLNFVVLEVASLPLFGNRNGLAELVVAWYASNF